MWEKGREEIFLKSMRSKWKKESCGNGDFLCFQTRRTKKIFPRTETCESNFLPRREANRIEIGICERVFEMRFLLRKPKLKDLDLDWVCSFRLADQNPSLAHHVFLSILPKKLFSLYTLYFLWRNLRPILFIKTSPFFLSFFILFLNNYELPLRGNIFINSIKSAKNRCKKC